MEEKFAGTTHEEGFSLVMVNLGIYRLQHMHTDDVQCQP